MGAWEHVTVTVTCTPDLAALTLLPIRDAVPITASFASRSTASAEPSMTTPPRPAPTSRPQRDVAGRFTAGRELIKGRVSAFVLITFTALLLVAGLVLEDGGDALAAKSRAIGIAEEAARTGSQQLDLAAVPRPPTGTRPRRDGCGGAGLPHRRRRRGHRHRHRPTGPGPRHRHHPRPAAGTGRHRHLHRGRRRRRPRHTHPLNPRSLINFGPVTTTVTPAPWRPRWRHLAGAPAAPPTGSGTRARRGRGPRHGGIGRAPRG